MKISVNIIRVLVGVLFIFSGLVKANDPLGTAYKMEEYFEIWNADLATSSFFLKNILTGLFHFLNGHTLFMSVLMNGFEIIAGAALLFGWRMKLFSWLLLFLMIFFTILTGYTYQTGQPTNCGCFGDCIKITPEYSFYKDVLLSVLILFILLFRKHIKPLFPPILNTSVMVLSIVFSFGLQWYVLKYLPPVDCLPFKKGNSIPEKMKIPANAIPDSVVMTFVYEKQGQQVEFTADKFPDDFNDSLYRFIKRNDKVVRKGKNNEPPIKGFSLSGSTGQDSTEAILSLPYALLLFEEKPLSDRGSWVKQFEEIQMLASKKNIPLLIITSGLEEYIKNVQTRLPVMKCDFTAIRTAARANPTLYLINAGSVSGKWSAAEFEKAKTAISKTEVMPVQPLSKEVINLHQDTTAN
jgi:uncharacterized membrane protein YphA (DoxX/SURF4 family)